MMKDLREDYVRDLPQRVTSLKKWVEEGQVALVRNEFHKFKGTGATYGLPEISTLGETMERICAELPPEQALPLTLQGAAILEEIYALRQQGLGLNLDEHIGYKELKESLAHE